MRKNSLLYFTVFAAGMTTLAVELSASRLLGYVFGTSNLVWASIIGLILVYLTLGYFLGGRLADRHPDAGLFYRLLAWGALSSGVIPFLSRPVLRTAADAFDRLAVGVLAGSFSAVLVLFILPVTLLGMISPFAIRLAMEDASRAGTVAGRVYAISTLGSFVGTFIPVLWLIPLIGVTLTFLVFGAFLSLVALWGLWRYRGGKTALRWAWIPLLLGLLALLWGRGTIKNTPGQIFERESAYNYIQVLEVDGFRYLRLNEGQGVHSVYHPWQLQYNGPWMQVLAAPFFNPAPYAPEQVRSMAIVGLAAGTTARQATAVFGDIPIDGFEIDPAIIQVGEQFFGMNLPNLRPIPQDGRWGLEHSPRRYSIISVDAYRPPYIPWHLTTRQFFQSVYEHLEADGVLVINVGRAPNDRRLIEGLAATIGTVFPSLYVMDVPDTFNSILYATRQPTQVENFYANYQALQMRADVHPLLLAAVTRAVASLHANPCAGDHPAAGCVVFTDDRAPIEWITNDMVLRYVLAGGVEDLQ